MIDLPGFAEGYATYDIIAKRSRAYALCYPFIELILGIAYLANIALTFTNLVTLLIMAISSIGVSQALIKKRAKVKT